jgi:hypothetical protein
MNKLELEHRLTVFVAEQPVDRFEISDSVEANLQVELTLKPNIPITERFIVRLEKALHQKIGSLALFRVRRNVLIIRFTLKGGYSDDSAADRIQELPFPYVCADVVIPTKIPQELTA